MGVDDTAGDRGRHGDSAGAAPGPDALPAGARVGEFEIRRVLGEGGFGIVYLAYDHSLSIDVALKEYLPAAYAYRQDQRTILPRSAQFRSTFEAGLRSFLQEARTIAQFDHPALVRVRRVWEANGTAYIAMAYCAGLTLREALRRDPGMASEAALKALLRPLLDGVEQLHARHFYHRDIAPDNIIVQADGSPVLIDFGAARNIIGSMTQALTSVLKPGYAPIEQYAEDSHLKQGPWTDVYGFAAMLRWAVTGEPPPSAVSRVLDDPLVPLARLAPPGYSETFLRAIDAGLALRPEDRPNSLAAFRAALGLDPGPLADDQRTIVYHPSESRKAAEVPGSAIPAATDAGRVTIGGDGVRERTAEPATIAPAAPLPGRMPPWSSRTRSAVAAVAIALIVVAGGAIVHRLVGTPAREEVAAVTGAARSTPSPAGTAPRSVAPPDAPVAPVVPSPSAAPPDRPGPAASAPPPAESSQSASRQPAPAVAKEPAPPAPIAVPPARPAPPPVPRPSTPPTPAPVPPRAAPAPTPAPAVTASPAAGPAQPAPPATTQGGGRQVLPAAPKGPSPPPSPVAEPASPVVAPSGTAKESPRPPGPVAAQPDRDPRAQYEAARAQEEGRGVPRDLTAAAKGYRSAAEQGYVPAMVALARACESGRGVAVDGAEAVRWYERAAGYGDVAAMRALGDIFRRGRAVVRDDARAASWLRKAADLGDASAQNSLGWLYENGQGVGKDDAQATRLYELAAMQGNAAAENNLGVTYATGRGVARNDSVALTWYRKAVDHGNGDAQANLGYWYETGRSVYRDATEAARLYEQSARQGNARGQFLLGRCYERGIGVARDPEQALAWYRKAAQGGHPDAVARLRVLTATPAR